MNSFSRAPRIHSGLLAAAAVASDVLCALVQDRLASGATAPDAFRGLHVDP